MWNQGPKVDELDEYELAFEALCADIYDVYHVAVAAGKDAEEARSMVEAALSGEHERQQGLLERWAEGEDVPEMERMPIEDVGRWLAEQQARLDREG